MVAAPRWSKRFWRQAGQVQRRRAKNKCHYTKLRRAVQLMEKRNRYPDAGYSRCGGNDSNTAFSSTNVSFIPTKKTEFARSTWNRAGKSVWS
jgi:hypothetical protein